MLEYGPVKDITMQPAKLCAYVTYRHRADAEQACAALAGNLNVRNTRLRVTWARRKERTDRADPPNASTAFAIPQPPPPAPPPRGSMPPPGSRLPPGIRAAAALYPSTDPDSRGARPERE